MCALQGYYYHYISKHRTVNLVAGDKFVTEETLTVDKFVDPVDVDAVPLDSVDPTSLLQARRGQRPKHVCTGVQLDSGTVGNVILVNGFFAMALVEVGGMEYRITEDLFGKLRVTTSGDAGV